MREFKPRVLVEFGRQQVPDGAQVDDFGAAQGDEAVERQRRHRGAVVVVQSAQRAVQQLRDFREQIGAVLLRPGIRRKRRKLLFNRPTVSLADRFYGQYFLNVQSSMKVQDIVKIQYIKNILLYPIDYTHEYPEND